MFGPRSKKPWFKGLTDRGTSGAQDYYERKRRKAEREAEKRERDQERQRKKAEWEARQRERERRNAEREARQREYERKKAEREAEKARKKQEYEARKAEQARKKAEYEQRKARRELERASRKDNNRQRGGRPIFGADGQRIGTQPTVRERKRMDTYFKLVLNENNRGQKKEGHHSHPMHLGGDKKQPLTVLKQNNHSRLHNDMQQFFRMRGIEVSGKKPGDAIKEYSRRKLVDLTGDFYLDDGPNGGARYTNAARDFFDQNPDIVDSSKKRIADLKQELKNSPPQEHRNVIARFYQRVLGVK